MVENNQSPTNLIAVQLVTFNSEGTLEACLDALSNQSYKGYELIVVDNASIDNTHFILKKRNIAYVPNSYNVGYAAAHNQALAMSNTPFVITLNPDVKLFPSFIEEIINPLLLNGNIGSACGYLMRIEDMCDDPQKIDSKGLYITPHRRQRLIDEGVSIKIDKYNNNRCFYIFGPDGSAAVYRRAMLNDIAINGEIFDEDFFIHKEDVDISWRACLRGWQSIHVPLAKACHIRTFRPGHKPNKLILRLYAHRNRYLLIAKNDTLFNVFLDLPFIVIYELLIFIYLVMYEREALEAYLLVWSILPDIIKKRRYIQSRRLISKIAMAKWFNIFPSMEWYD